MRSIGRIKNQTTNVEVQTYFHFIMSGLSGVISNTTLKSQMKSLNTLFKPYGYSFCLGNTTRANNKTVVGILRLLIRVPKHVQEIA